MTFRIAVDNPEGQTHSLRMHKDILDAIVERDGAAARLAMRKLIDYSRRTVLEISVQRGAKGSSKGVKGAKSAKTGAAKASRRSA